MKLNRLSRRRVQTGSVAVEALMFIPLLLVMSLAFVDLTSLIRSNDKVQDISHTLVRAISMQDIQDGNELRGWMPAYLQQAEQLMAKPGSVLGVKVQFLSEQNSFVLAEGACQPPELQAELTEVDLWMVSVCYQPAPKDLLSRVLVLLSEQQSLVSHAIYKRR
ncbi:TPA: TadE/TadG family type IV pilus assembly protein [Vibrio vulnificus]